MPPMEGGNKKLHKDLDDCACWASADQAAKIAISACDVKIPSGTASRTSIFDTEYDWTKVPLHNASDPTPRRPWKSENSFASILIETSKNMGMQGVRAQYFLRSFPSCGHPIVQSHQYRTYPTRKGLRDSLPNPGMGFFLTLGCLP